MDETALATRRAVAARVSDAYSRQSSCVGVAIIGSVARGHPDSFSDVDLMIAWSEMPSLEVRREVILDAGSNIEIDWSNTSAPTFRQLFVQRGGILGEVWPGTSTDPDSLRLRERYFVQGLKIGVIGVLVEAVDKALVLRRQEFPISDGESLLRNSLRYAVAVYGHDVFDNWRIRAEEYPSQLQASMVSRYAEVGEPWWLRYALVARSDRLALRLIVDDVLTRIFRLVAVVNKMFLPDTRFKWAQCRISEYPIQPRNFLPRLELVMSADPLLVVADVESLLLETIDLVAEQGIPGEYEYLRSRVEYSTPIWGPAPNHDSE